MAVSLADLKAHLRVDHDFDDVILSLHIAAAEAHLAEIGVSMGPRRTAATDVAVMLIAESLFEGDGRANMRDVTADRLIAPQRLAVG